MDPAYGIGTDNRYALFCLDDDTSDATGAAIARKAKIARKAAAKAAAAAAEKENKASAALAAQQAAAVAERQQQQQEHRGGAHNKQARNNDGQRRAAPIRDSQNIRSSAGGAPREAGEKPAFERRPPVNGEQRFNRRPNADGSAGPDSRPPRRNNNGPPFTGDRKPLGGGSRPPFEGRQREFDRKSGSDKTGVKAVDKRDGGGAHNWGTHKQDIEDLQNGTATAGGDASDASDKEGEKSGVASETVNGADGVSSTPAAATKPETPEQIAAAAAAAEAVRLAEEEARELTLDEWKAQRGVRAKPQFNIRKAGEGEDTSQWKQMVALQSRKKNETDSDEELEYDPSMYPQRVGRQKHLLDIEFHFNDGRRGGLNSRKGPGAPGAPRQGGDRPGPGGRPIGGGPGGRLPRRDQLRADQQDSAAVATSATAPSSSTSAALPSVAVAVEANVAAPVAVAGHVPQISFVGEEQQQRPERKPRAPRNDEHQQRRRPAYEDRQVRSGYASFGGQHAAPKVDDERAFPSLG